MGSAVVITEAVALAIAADVLTTVCFVLGYGVAIVRRWSTIRTTHHRLVVAFFALTLLGCAAGHGVSIFNMTRGVAVDWLSANMRATIALVAVAFAIAANVLDVPELDQRDRIAPEARR